MRILTIAAAFVLSLSVVLATSRLHAAENDAAADATPDFARDVAPMLTAKCGGCHGDLEAKGEFSLATYDALMKGGEHGPSITPGESNSSRLFLMSSGKLEPTMPPEGEEPLTAAEIERLAKWIDAGAKGPAGSAARPMPVFPDLAPAEGADSITALAWSPDGRTIAIGRFGTVELAPIDEGGKRSAPTAIVEGLAGKVNRLTFSADGKTLVAAGGVSGALGEAALIEVANPANVRKISGHADAIYDATLSPDGTMLATAGYDRTILLRDANTGQTLRTLAGHNGAVFDLAFSPDGSCLVSASADETAKVWHVATGERLDTLNQCEAEQWACAFDPKLGRIYAAGADHRVRAWYWTSRETPRINPLLHARFAHEGTVTHLALAVERPLLASAADDGSLKVWRTADLTVAWVGPTQTSVPTGLAFDPAGMRLAISRIDGTWETYDLGDVEVDSRGGPVEQVAAVVAPMPTGDLPPPVEEIEPNDNPAAAHLVEAPLRIAGVIEGPGDVDGYRFHADAGERWIVETNAARSNSPIDTFVEIVSPDGAPILRTRLQAVRDSYFTFRGKDSDTSNDFRVHNWQEMELDDLMYANGEVVKLWLYPRGPDSGFKVYPGFGNRRTYFDTPALSHALGEPCWIVREAPPGVEPIPNGLPIFPIYYENDDDGERRLGKDSRLHFTPVDSGEYVVRVTDVRGEGSPDHKYELTIRPARPGFSVRAKVEKADAVPAEGGREIEFTAERIDGFEGPIELAIDGLPDGWTVTTPTIEAGQLQALGAIYAAQGAESPTEEAWKNVTLVARATIDGEAVERPVASLPQPKIAGPPKIGMTVTSVTSGEAPSLDGKGDDADAEVADAVNASDEPLEVSIRPGETIELRVDVDRKEVKERISFGNEDSGRNLPYGVYVADIGLNGLLIVEEKSERTFFVTAAPIATPQTRRFHLRANIDGGLVTRPITIHVKP